MTAPTGDNARWRSNGRQLRRLFVSLTFVIALVPCLTCGFMAAYVSATPDRTVFLGTGTFQVSAVRHSDGSNWDLVAEEQPPVYLGANPNPGACIVRHKDDTIFALTGIWVAWWDCKP
jgi:hypothetical protein